jgi:hypothetical protein
VFDIVVKADSVPNYYAISSKASIDQNTADYTAIVTLQRLKINLLGPNLTPDTNDGFIVFGDITGAAYGLENGGGVKIYDFAETAYTDNELASTYKDGRWYAGTVVVKHDGITSLIAKAERNGNDEFSNVLSVNVGDDLNYVEDSYFISSTGLKIAASTKRKIPAYTAFINSYDLKAQPFQIYTKVANSSITDDVNFVILGKEYPANYDKINNYWYADISELVGYGDQQVYVSTNGNSTLAGTLLLLYGY